MLFFRHKNVWYTKCPISNRPAEKNNFCQLRMPMFVRCSRLSLWRRANARNVSFLTLYGGQFTLSTPLIIINYPSSMKSLTFSCFYALNLFICLERQNFLQVARTAKSCPNAKSCSEAPGHIRDRPKDNSNHRQLKPFSISGPLEIQNSGVLLYFLRKPGKTR